MEAVTTLSLQGFLENVLGFRQVVEVKPLFSSKPEPKHYSAAKGLRTASLNSGLNEDRWIAMHLAEEPGTVLYNAMYERDNFLHTLHRVENYVQKQLVVHGLQLPGRLVGDARPIDEMLIVMEDFVRMKKAENAALTRIESSVVIKRLNTELNWDVYLRFVLWVDGENAFIQVRIPSIVSDVARLITLIQGEHARSAVTRFLSDFEKHSQMFQAMPDVDPAQVIVHHLINKPDTMADTIYGIYKTSVHMTANFSWDESSQMRVRSLKAWEHLERAYQVIWSGAVEVARTHLGTYLAFNKEVYPKD